MLFQNLLLQLMNIYSYYLQRAKQMKGHPIISTKRNGYFEVVTQTVFDTKGHFARLLRTIPMKGYQQRLLLHLGSSYTPGYKYISPLLKSQT